MRCDAENRSKALRGSQHYRAKLTERAVAEILVTWRLKQALRQRLEEDFSREALAEQYGVTPSTIERITRREGWAHVREPSTAEVHAAALRVIWPVLQPTTRRTDR